MGYQNPPVPVGGVWALAGRQHGVVARRQLLALGLGPQAIKHRLASGRLHSVSRGVYAVGRPGLTRRGRWMAAVLGSGTSATLSHASAAALWGFGASEPFGIELSVPRRSGPQRRGIHVHRRASLIGADITRNDGIPVTSPICTLVDLAVRLGPRRLEAAVNEAVKLGLTDPEALRTALEAFRSRPGVALIRETLDRRTFVVTDSELERRFLPLAREAGLPQPETGRRVNGFRVDFHWPTLGLVVETDGLRYHSTPAQQARDRVRDQAHAAAGLTSLRFTHAQVRFAPDHVTRTLKQVAGRLSTKGRG